MTVWDVWYMLEWVHMGTLGPARRVLPQMPLTKPAVAQGLSDQMVTMVFQTCSALEVNVGLRAKWFGSA